MKLHQFNKSIFFIQTLNNITQLKTYRNLPLINLKLNFSIFNSLSSNSNLYSFRLKTLLNNLPTMDNLNIRQPYLYLTSNCSYCNQKENTLHLLQCNAHKTILLTTLKYYINQTIEFLNITKYSEQTITAIFLAYNNSSQTPIPNLLLYIIQGTIPQQLFILTQHKLNKSTTNFFITLSNNILNWFYSDIWQPRNQR